MSDFAHTVKQQEIMGLVVEATARGQLITVNQLLAALSYKPGRASLHCSLKFLKKHGFVTTKNHGRNGASVIPSASGMSVFKLKPIV